MRQSAQSTWAVAPPVLVDVADPGLGPSGVGGLQRRRPTVEAACEAVDRLGYPQAVGAQLVGVVGNAVDVHRDPLNTQDLNRSS